jgi:UDP-N-acetylmuramoyl-tripeptide--D-alanyl-D-alanine ligase
MKIILKRFLRFITALIIKKYQPLIIAVTGSVGKTSTKDGIYTAFSNFFNIRKSEGNLNTEFGAPLVFLKINKSGETLKEWIIILLKGLWLIILRDKNYPEIVVVELAADKPGDMDYFAQFISPDVAVVTAIGEIPVHIEFYKSPKEVAKEKEKMVKALKKEGTAVLNIDDLHVSSMETKSNKITFGFKKEADVLIKHFKTESFKGSSLVLEYKGKDFPIFLSSCIGDSFAYIAASIFAVGVTLHINPEKLPKMIEKIRPAKGRLTVIKGIKNTTILDGSYNASPTSMMSALRALKELDGKRKIVILGDMLELGKFSSEEHRKVGKFAKEVADYIIAVGTWSEEIKKAASQDNSKNVFAFKKSEDVIKKLEEVVREEDVILIKGSQGVRTEKIVFSIMRDPERADELLVRQNSYWKKHV